MKVEKGTLIFDGGRELPVYGILGIGVDREPDLYAGYDCALYFDGEPNEAEDRNSWPLTPSERAELADFMIARWGEFKNAE